MFNQEMKEKFIEEYTSSASTREACVKFFNILEKYENDWNADICTRSADDLQPIIDKWVVGIRGKSKGLRWTILRKYVTWCMEHEVPGACDEILYVDTLGIQKMKLQTVTSPLHLQTYLNQVFDPESEKTSDNILRCYYWLAYGGLQEDEILNVKMSDVDLSNMVVIYEGAEIPIYREGIAAFRNCATLDQFVYKHPKYEPIYRDRVEGDTLIRGIRGQITTGSIRALLSRKAKASIDEGKTNLHLSHYKVWLSGLFYRMYELEIAGFPVDFSAAAVEFTDRKSYKSENNPKEFARMQRGIANEYKKDYEVWKMTFTAPSK